MNDALLFSYLRRKKIAWKGEGGLTQAEVDEFNAVLREARAGGTPQPEIVAGGALTPSTGLSRPRAFFDTARATFGPLQTKQVEGIEALLVAVAGWPIAWVAYGLATAWHETARTMQPIKEHGGQAYFHRMYDIQGNRPDKARELGNLAPGDGAKFAGRGYVQLTGRANYVNAGLALGLDLPENPDLAMKPEAAAKILRWGMEGGKFTGKKLADYLSRGLTGSNVAAFREARRIINGTDKAGPIADLAVKFQAALEAGGWA